MLESTRFSELAAVGLGLASAASWGAGDFTGGLASRRTHVFSVTTVAFGAGAVLLVALALVTGERLPSRSDLGWAVGVGLMGPVALAALYRALAIGRMGVVAPLTAVLAAAVPVLIAAFLEGPPAWPKLLGFGLAMLAVWSVSRPEGESGPSPGAGLALLAGFGFGAFYVMMDQIGDGAVLWPLAAARAVACLVTIAFAAVNRRPWLPTRGLLPLVLGSGALDVGGNVFYLMAAQIGRLDVAAVLSSLYPASTVLLARLVLRERVSRGQGLGVAAALAAIALIAAG